MTGHPAGRFLWFGPYLLCSLLFTHLLELCRTYIPQRRVQMDPVVEHFDVFEDRLHGRLTALIDLLANQFGLVASRDDAVLLLEVKGLSGRDIAVELTPNEYEQMRSRRKSYELCVVTAALDERPQLRCFSYNASLDIWSTDRGETLDIREIVSARIIASSGRFDRTE